MDYATLKTIHLTCVVASGAGFLFRGALSLRDPQILRRRRSLRIAPHIIDSMLLASALAMLWQIGPSALTFAWLQAKIVLLFAYIVLGSLALSPRRPRSVRASAFLCACLVFGGIVAIALSKQVPRVGI